MSDIEGELIQCDQCRKEINRSKAIMDKGVERPELLKKAKEDDRDFVSLCTVCADAGLGGEKKEVRDALPNIRQFL